MDLDTSLFMSLQKVLFERKWHQMPIEYIDNATVTFRNGNKKKVKATELKKLLDADDGTVVGVNVMLDLSFIHETVNGPLKEILNHDN